ncbi:MAG: hypothetical protein NZ555_07335 [Geminicoccaceae bacterium]|nr:hypothetical protein [Geminicoccaceae bacterium]MCX8101583.1 hypothetical protein [Geminicoccaceae bacterium]MDW8369870.1 hypothetical protein [Geminicoccaceae bacterium]
MRNALIAALSILCLAVSPARADEIGDQIDAAKKLYEEGDLAGAVSELEFVMQALKAKFGEAFLATFPAPLEGWEVEENGGKAGSVPFLGGTNVSRSYRQVNGPGRIEAQLSTGGGMLQGLAQMFANPQMLAMQPNAKRVRIQRETATTTFDPKTKEGQLVLDLGGKATIMLQGSGLAGPEPLVELAQRWDLKQARALAGL